MTIAQVYDRFLKCDSITTDTRKITQNTMFFALKGEHFNGNEFTQEALHNGARYCVIDEEKYKLNDQCILVTDVLECLQKLATFHRQHLGIPIIVLTGSNGKTTTKELINAVLSITYSTSATQGNLNNHIGVPISLLKMSKANAIGIIEMGANHIKEIEFLTDIVQPDYGLITNFGKAHIEGFGSVEGVIQGKSELFEYLKAHDKLIFVNETDPLQIRQSQGYSNLYKFGTPEHANSYIELESTQPFLTISYQGRQIKTHLTGAYNYNNIAVAVAIGTYFKVAPERIISAIENYTPNNNRSQILEQNGNTIIMDAYNANPTSMMAALENFIQLNQERKMIFLGDMFELGTTAKTEHQCIVDFIETHQLKNVHLIGENFYSTIVSSKSIQKFKSFDDIKEFLPMQSIENAFLLIKGSRGMALERILELL